MKKAFEYMGVLRNWRIQRAPRTCETAPQNCHPERSEGSASKV